MRQTLMRAAVLAILGAWALAACQPTGDPRCDSELPAIAHITANGYRLDCAPDFEGRRNDGRLALAWTSTSDRTVYVWPDRFQSQRTLVKTLYHEAGHTAGWSNEWHADHWAWCHMKPHQRDGVGFLAPMPTQSGCWRYR